MYRAFLSSLVGHPEVRRLPLGLRDGAVAVLAEDNIL